MNSGLLLSVIIDILFFIIFPYLERMNVCVQIGPYRSKNTLTRLIHVDNDCVICIVISSGVVVQSMKSLDQETRRPGDQGHRSARYLALECSNVSSILPWRTATLRLWLKLGINAASTDGGCHATPQCCLSANQPSRQRPVIQFGPISDDGGFTISSGPSANRV